jgi:BirA family biotin operon repressor/biotin-[acetyl-CoA-carboxylase] ligase
MRAPLVRDLIAAWTAETSITDVVVLDRIDSTNAEVARRGRVGTAVLADVQTAGRGRLGRAWTDVPYAGLAVSVLLPPPSAHLGWVPLATGLALRRAVLETTGYAADLKWPNDLLDPTSGRKLAGILCELSSAGVVIGAGLNVDHTEAELPVPTATSLALVLARAGESPGRVTPVGLAAEVGPETGPAISGEFGGEFAGHVSREDLAGRFLREVARRHTALMEGGGAVGQLRAEYRDACATIGTRVRIESGGRTWAADAIGVDDEGRLAVDGPDGRATVAAGDVHHVRPMT